MLVSTSWNLTVHLIFAHDIFVMWKFTLRPKMTVKLKSACLGFSRMQKSTVLLFFTHGFFPETTNYTFGSMFDIDVLFQLTICFGGHTALVTLESLCLSVHSHVTSQFFFCFEGILTLITFVSAHRWLSWNTRTGSVKSVSILIPMEVCYIIVF